MINEKIKIRKSNKEKAPIELLLLADPSEKSIKKSLKNGSSFVALNNDEIVGAYILVSQKKGTLEIVNIAVPEGMQNKGIGKLLVADAIKRAKKAGAKKLLVGTGNSSLNQLAFYKKCGFVICGTKKDYFIKKYEKPIFENGVRCRDMIRLEMDL